MKQIASIDIHALCIQELLAKFLDGKIVLLIFLYFAFSLKIRLMAEGVRYLDPVFYFWFFFFFDWNIIHWFFFLYLSFISVLLILFFQLFCKLLTVTGFLQLETCVTCHDIRNKLN